MTAIKVIILVALLIGTFVSLNYFNVEQWPIYMFLTPIILGILYFLYMMIDFYYQTKETNGK